MTVFAIALKEPNNEVIEKVKENYPEHYPLNETFILISSDELTENVAMQIGLKGDNRIEDASGAVFSLRSNYSGYTSRSLWEWLEKFEDRF